MGLPRSVSKCRALDTQESRSRCGFPDDLLGHRAIAQDFLVIHAGCRTVQQPACPFSLPLASVLSSPAFGAARNTRCM
eukprot:2377102-Pyramimonas_sp.AAC.1